MNYVLNYPAPKLPVSGYHNARYVLANPNSVEHPDYPGVRGALVKSKLKGWYLIYDEGQKRFFPVTKYFGEEHDILTQTEIFLDTKIV